MARGPFYVYFHCRPDGSPFYVGKGTASRCRNLRRRCNPHYLNVVEKYGKESIRVLAVECDDESMALRMENCAILILRALGADLTNVTEGGDGSVGLKHTPEARQKMSESQKGKTLSEEHRRKISKSNTGAVFSEQRKKKISEKATGRKLTDETKAKLSDIHSGRVMSESHKRRLSAASIGKPKTEEAKAAMREAHKRRPPPSAETRAKMSASHLLRNSKNVNK